jgi:hypothetical protein
MLEIDAHEFVGLTNFLRSLTLMGKQFPERVKEGGHGDPGIAAELRKHAVQLSEMGLRASRGALLELAETVERYGPYNELADQRVGSVCHILRLELEGRKFLQVQREDLYSPEWPSFDINVHTRFPTITEEISEAGKCLALRRSTACVMHLMRILEVGLHSLADEMNVPFENKNWGTIIDQVEKRIREMSSATHGADWKKDQQFYSEAAAHFRILKDAWRNHAMHVHERYSEERAEAIFNSVRAFMQHLATKLYDPLGKLYS